MNTYYLIDYENVGDDGILNCSKLDKTDKIHIFYTGDKTRININILNNHGASEFEVHKIPSGNQSVDMHLVSFLGYLLGINKGKGSSYIIISKDKNYDNVIKFLTNKSKDKIVRAVKINPSVLKQSKDALQTVAAKQSNNKNKKNKTKLNQEIQQRMSAEGYYGKAINNVAKIVGKCYGQNNFLRNVHNALRNEYDDYLEIYKSIKPIISKYEK